MGRALQSILTERHVALIISFMKKLKTYRHQAIRPFMLALFFIFIGINSISSQSEIPLFKDGDVVCFVGNSITHGGSYHTLLQLYCATRFPKEKVEYYNCGISGDNAFGMLSRLEDDILSHNPSHAFLMTGMNDVNMSLYSEEPANAKTLELRQKALNSYYQNTEKLAQRLSENDVKPIFITPSIYDQTAKISRANFPGTNDALALCAAHIRKLAKRYDAPLVDFYSILNKINSDGQKLDSTFTIIGQDRVHPGDQGHFVMSYEMIKTIAPSEHISSIEINARKQRLDKALNCDVNIPEKSDQLEFSVLEEALPFPIRESLSETARQIPDYVDFNEQSLKVTKLSRGNYALWIADTKIGSFTNKELSSGINLVAFKNTPQYKQAEKVSDLCFKYRDLQEKLRVLAMIEFKNLKDYTGDGSIKDKRAFLEAKCETQQGKSWYPYQVKTCNQYFEILPEKKSINLEIIKIRDEIYKVNQPIWYNYRLVKI